MTADLPDWHILVTAWIAEGNYGLTIPFLVGSRALMVGTSTTGRSDVEVLFEEIIQQPVKGSVVYFRWCDDIDSVVMASYTLNFPLSPKYDLVKFFSRRDGSMSMAVEKKIASRLNTKATQVDILEALISQAVPHVERGNYSRYWTSDGRLNGPFQEGDIVFIRKTLNAQI